MSRERAELSKKNPYHIPRYTIFYAGMAVGIGYGLTSDKDG